MKHFYLLFFLLGLTNCQRILDEFEEPEISRPRSKQRSQQREAAPVPLIIKQINEMNEDGSYTFGYESEDGSFRVETRGLDGVTRGKYGYIDAAGVLREVEYKAGGGVGYEPNGDHIKVPPPREHVPFEEEDPEVFTRRQQPVAQTTFAPRRQEQKVKQRVPSKSHSRPRQEVQFEDRQSEDFAVEPESPPQRQNVDLGDAQDVVTLKIDFPDGGRVQNVQNQRRNFQNQRQNVQNQRRNFEDQRQNVQNQRQDFQDQKQSFLSQGQSSRRQQLPQGRQNVRQRQEFQDQRASQGFSSQEEPVSQGFQAKQTLKTRKKFFDQGQRRDFQERQSSRQNQRFDDSDRNFDNTRNLDTSRRQQFSDERLDFNTERQPDERLNFGTSDRQDDGRLNIGSGRQDFDDAVFDDVEGFEDDSVGRRSGKNKNSFVWT